MNQTTLDNSSFNWKAGGGGTQNDMIQNVLK